MMTLHPTPRECSLLAKMGLLGLMGLALAGCHEVIGDRNVEGETRVENKIKTLDRGVLAGKVPDAAIQVSDDLFMIPAGLDEEGCEMFKPHSASGNPVKTAFYFRQADGGFGIARDPAVCKVEMTSMEPDEDGCERYRAVPVNADLPVENDVIYFRTADGGYSARKPLENCG